MFTGAPSYTILGLGTGPVTLSLVYDNLTHTGDAFVNGVDVVSGFAGYSYAFPSIVAFGGEDGEFTNVELQTNAPASTPEPSSVLLLLTVVVGLSARPITRRFLRRP